MLALLLVPTSDAILSPLHPQIEAAALFLPFICANLKTTTQFYIWRLTPGPPWAWSYE